MLPALTKTLYCDLISREERGLLRTLREELKREKKLTMCKCATI